MTARGGGDEPFAWWGPVWSPPAPRPLPVLIADGVLSVETAAVLWALLARRASLAVVAGPSGAGKTTLLTALLDLLPPGTGRYYVRGCYEPFAFLDDPAIDPRRTVLLVNEISAHLPTYLWGPGVRRVLTACAHGFALAATAHAGSAADLVALLAGYPLRVPAAEIAAFDLVVVLDAWREGEAVRREVAAVAALQCVAPAGGLIVTDVVARPRRGEPARVYITHVARVAGRLRGRDEEGGAIAGEVRRRSAALRDLTGVAPGEAVAAVAELGRQWAAGDVG